MILNENVDRKIIPIAGGKGGVGKSILAANIALSMALYGKKTVLVDLDLGGSNLHTLLGMKNIHPGVGNFLSGKKCSVQDLAVPTEWENLFFIPGDVLVCGIGELTKSIKARVVKGLLEIDADYIIIDLGGGTNFTVIDFFLISNSGLIVTTPQSTAIMNAYSFLKNYVFRFLQRAFFQDKTITAYLKNILKEQQPGGSSSVPGIIGGIYEISSEAGEKAEAFLEVLQPKLILNKLNEMEDVLIAQGLRDLCAKNLSLDLECLGTIMNNTTVDQSIDEQRPFILDNPDEIVTQEIHRISQKIIQSGQFPRMPLELDYYSDTFELAQIETENDIAAARKTTETMEEDRYDIDKLLELVRIQQSKIMELQSTVKILSMNH